MLLYIRDRRSTRAQEWANALFCPTIDAAVKCYEECPRSSGQQRETLSLLTLVLVPSDERCNPEIHSPVLPFSFF